MAMKSSGRGGRAILWVAIHTAEGARNKDDLWSFFNRDSTQASSHVGIDANGIRVYVPDHLASWTLRGGNTVSLNAELCAFASFTRDQWLGTAEVRGCKNPRQIVINAALWAKEKCEKYGIPKRKLSSAEVAAGKAGIIGHWNYTEGKRDGTHTDPGPNFPWDFFMDIVNGDAEEDEVSWTDPSGVKNREGTYEYNMKDIAVGSNSGVWQNHELLKSLVNAMTAMGNRLDAIEAKLNTPNS